MTEQNKNTPQEIDLIELFSNIWKWISKAFLSILYFFLRNILLFIAIITISIVMGFISSIISKPYYKTELFGISHTISNIETIQYLNNWNYKSDFTAEQLAKIKSIKAHYLLDLNNDGIWDIVEEVSFEDVTDTVIINKRMYQAFCLRAEVYDTSLVSAIKERAFKYLESNSRVANMNQIRLEQKKALIPKLEKEINDLDSLKTKQYFEQNKTQNDKSSLMILNEKEIKLYHDDILRLYRTKQSIELELFLSADAFEISQDFTIPRFNENSLTKIMTMYIKFGLIIAFILIVFWDSRKLFSRLLKEAKK